MNKKGVSLALVISLSQCTGACKEFALEPLRLPFILNGVCSPSEANYCSNPFEVFFRKLCRYVLIIAHLHTYFESDFGGCNSKQIWSVFLNLDRLWIINYDLLAWWWCDLTWIYICIKVVKFLDDRDPHSMKKMENFIC